MFPVFASGHEHRGVCIMWAKTAHARASLPLPLPRPKQLTLSTPTKDASSPTHPSSQTWVRGTFIAHANIFAGFARAFVYTLARTAVNAQRIIGSPCRSTSVAVSGILT
jgi:hypothetical protein